MTRLTNKNYKIYGDFPLTIEANKHKNLEPLLDWLRKEKSLLEELMLKHGAIRFRNFDVSTPEDFEKIARAIAPELKITIQARSPEVP